MGTIHSLKNTAADLLAAGQDPPRPFEETGKLPVPATAATRSELIQSLLPTITKHLEVLTRWEVDAKTVEQIGLFNFYILGFPVANGSEPFLQLWAEPGEELAFEVSGGEREESLAAWLTVERQEALQDRGFEKSTVNYRKRVRAKAPGELQALAREMLAIATEVLGYTGAAAMDYKLHLGDRFKPARTIDALTPEELRAILNAKEITVRDPGEKPNVVAFVMSGHEVSAELLMPPEPGRTDYQLTRLTMTHEAGADRLYERVNNWNENLAVVKVYTPAPKVVRFERDVILVNGIALENLIENIGAFVGIVHGALSRTRA